MKDEQIARLNAERTATLIPEVRGLAREHISSCAAEGIKLLVVRALCSFEEQAAIYAKGRTTPGKIVTNAKPGMSWHNFGRAYDVCIIEYGQPDWKSKKYTKVGALGKTLGLVWGGDFRSIKGDLGHFEYHPGMTIRQAKEEVARQTNWRDSGQKHGGKSKGPTKI